MNKIFISVFSLCVVLLSVPIYGYLSQSEKSSEPLRIAESSACVLPLQAKVLQIEYYPLSNSNPSLLDVGETGLNVSVASQQNYVSNLSSELIRLTGEATKFHGYKNPNAPQFLQYSVIDTKKYYEKIPRGFPLKPNEGIYRPHYSQIMKQENICDYVDNKGVTEVWMFGYHHGAIEPDESRMASRLGDFSNSGPKEEALPAQYKMPVCSKPYVLYNFNYTRAALEMFHNRIHQLENILPRAEGKYPPTPQNTARGASLFWGNFSEYVQPYTVKNYNSACGNAHYTPNWTSLSDDYKYNLQNSRLNNCEAWNPDSSKSTYVNASCAQWGCTEEGFYLWYQQNLPGYNNGITFNGAKINNWWEAVYDPVAYLEKGGLTGNSIYNNCTVLAPSPTKTPIPSLTITPSLTAIPPTGAICNPDGEEGITFADLRLARREIAGREITNKASCMTGGSATSFADLRKIRHIIAGLETH